MKTVSISNESTEILQLLQEANEGDIILELSDGRQFIVSEIDDFDLEIVQTNRNEKLMKLLDERRKQTQTIPLDEVKRRLGIE